MSTPSAPAEPLGDLLGLPTPAALLDLDRLDRNIEGMAAKARRLGVRLRPHAKTHKCAEIAHRQLAAGASGLTVSTLEEVRMLADAGAEDLTWAFPLPLGRIDEALELGGRLQLGLVIESEEALAALEARGRTARVLLEVDCGYGRSGVDPSSELALLLAARLAASEHLELGGILSHSGDAYAGGGRERIAEVAAAERSRMVALADRLRREGIAVDTVSIGSTPAMAMIEDLAGVTEVRPGNYVFHDLTQVALGAAGEEDCALTVLASVVSAQPGAAHSVVDAGALALSKDRVPGGEGFGLVVAAWSSAGDPLDLGPKRPWLRALSQEHGILSRPLPVGGRVRVLPNHACLTSACFDEVFALRGREIEGRWPIHRRRS